MYIQEDGTVKYNFSQAKQILDMFRLLCQGQSEPHQMLCELFDAQTEHGQDMSYYNKQIQQATAAIAQQFGQKTVILCCWPWCKINEKLGANQH